MNYVSQMNGMAVYGMSYYFDIEMGPVNKEVSVTIYVSVRKQRENKFCLYRKMEM